MSKDNLRDGRVKNWFYLENDLLDREDLTIYEKSLDDNYEVLNKETKLVYKRKADDFKKWIPREPFSPHWYKPESLKKLIAGYLKRL